MDFVYTKHAQKKFQDLENLGLKISNALVEKTVLHPLHLDDKNDLPQMIASGKLDKEHVLRVVYREERGIILIITFYPGKKGRYYQ